MFVSYALIEHRNFDRAFHYEAMGIPFSSQYKHAVFSFKRNKLTKRRDFWDVSTGGDKFLSRFSWISNNYILAYLWKPSFIELLNSGFTCEKIKYDFSIKIYKAFKKQNKIFHCWICFSVACLCSFPHFHSCKDYQPPRNVRINVSIRLGTCAAKMPTFYNVTARVKYANIIHIVHASFGNTLYTLADQTDFNHVVQG